MSQSMTIFGDANRPGSTPLYHNGALGSQRSGQMIFMGVARVRHILHIPENGTFLGCLSSIRKELYLGENSREPVSQPAGCRPRPLMPRERFAASLVRVVFCEHSEFSVSWSPSGQRRCLGKQSQR